MNLIFSFFFYFIYSYFLLPLFVIVLIIISPFNKKVREGIAGRTRSMNDLKTLDMSTAKTVWIHCASHGEYEQAKPIINALKRSQDGIKIILTFFSPSGYKRVNDENVDLKLYLPFDFPHSIKRLHRSIKPNILILAGYDVWPNAVKWTRKSGTPVVIISARLRHNSHRLKPVILIFQRFVYSFIDEVLAVTKGDAERFKKFGIKENAIKVLGNTRYDRVTERKGEPIMKEEQVSKFCASKRVMVMGSIWRSDLTKLMSSLLEILGQYPDLSLILAPHEPDDNFVNQLSDELLLNEISSIRFSELDSTSEDRRVLIVDNVGILAGLYRFADIAYLGGGFGPGVHNVMEPAVYDVPVLYGPKLKSSDTARYLSETGSGFIVENGTEFKEIFDSLFTNEEFRLKAGKAAGQVILDHMGATQRTAEIIQGFIR